MNALLGPLLDIRLTDVVDILLVTALVYTAIVWIRRTRAALVAAGIVILGALYVAARMLGLQLTAWIFQGFFAIFLIVIVVVFQEELRQLFEQLAVWSLRRRRKAVPPSSLVDTLVPCLADLARDRVGALVVLTGNQPIARHVHGGIELDGRLSVPLLKSLFDVHSPGHDGAVLIDGERVTRFAAHLPLSSDFRQLAGVGTRHGAALGLAELTDALCVVVSEERGRISVAQDGRLSELRDPQALGPVIRRFVGAREPAPTLRASWRQLVLAHWIEKLAAVATVLMLWYAFVPGGRSTQETFAVPVEVTGLPAGYELEEVTPSSVEATLEGPARAFYLLDRRRLSVTVDAALARVGRRTFEIEADDVRRPRELQVVEVHPAQVRVAFRRAGSRAPVEGGR